jgi:hypothetical protein
MGKGLMLEGTSHTQAKNHQSCPDYLPIFSFWHVWFDRIEGGLRLENRTSQLILSQLPLLEDFSELRYPKHLSQGVILNPQKLYLWNEGVLHNSNSFKFPSF